MPPLTEHEVYVNMFNMTSYDGYPYSGDKPEKSFKEAVDDLKARWLVETGEGVPYINLDLTSSRADQLRLKEAEYKERMKRMHETGQLRHYAAEKIKAGLLDTLLSVGRLDMFDGIAQLDVPQSFHDLYSLDESFGWSLTETLGEKYPERRQFTLDDYASEIFEIGVQSFNLLQAYVANGGEGVSGGTGLTQLQ